MLGVLRSIAFLLVCLVSLCGFSPRTLAAEEILDYDVLAELKTDGKMVVRETITVNVENRRIRHGITRSYPVRQRVDETGLRHYTFNVLSVRLDGAQAPYSVSEGAGYMTGMAIGSAKTYVSKGIHTYEITYETDGHVRFMEDHDELFLNAIGTDNAFPVNKASFSLQLPAGAVIRKTDGFTGRVGSEEKAFVRTGPSSFRTTRVLRPKEAFTVLVAWNKGVVQAHESFANRIAAMRDTLSISYGVLIALLSFYFWWIKRRTPLTVIPQFTPPQGYGPGALARFLDKGKTAQVLSDMIWTSVWGWSRLDQDEQEKASPVYRRAEPARESGKWHFGESRKIRDLLLEDKQEMQLGATAQFRAALKRLGIDRAAKVDDLTELCSFLPLALPVISLLFYWFLMHYGYHSGLESGDGALVMLILMGMTASPGVFFVIMWLKLRMGSIFGAIFAAISLWFLALLFFAATVLVMEMDFALVIPALVSVVAPIVAFCCPVFVLTEKGMQIDAHVKGLRMYIETAEKDRLAVINAPEDTIEKYEEILPYAIALGCAQAWQKRFEPLLEVQHYEPKWTNRTVRGLHSAPVRVADFEKSIGKTISAIAAADAARRAASSSSRTSSRGGRSSGRGSGGGGVGGW